MFKRDWVNAVRELLERNLNVYEIAHRLGLDIDDVNMIVEVLKNLIDN